ASRLTDEPCRFKNVPELADVRTTIRLLRGLGVELCGQEGHAVTLRARSLSSYEAPYDLVKTMRASFLALGPLLAREGRARVSTPGGCAIGARPVNLPLAGFEEMGVPMEGAGSTAIRIQGVTQLRGIDHEVIADRIEAGTFLVAGAITGGDCRVRGARAEHLDAFLQKLEEAGIDVDREDGAVRVRGAQRPRR